MCFLVTYFFALIISLCFSTSQKNLSKKFDAVNNSVSERVLHALNKGKMLK